MTDPRLHGWRLPEHFASRVSILTAANILAAALLAVPAVLVPRTLGPDQYGLVALILSYVGLVYSVLDARTSEGCVRWLADFEARGERREALAFLKMSYGLDVGIACLGLLAVAATAGWAEEHLVKSEGATALMRTYAAMLVLGAPASTSSAVLTVAARFSLLAVIRILCASVQVGTILACLRLGYGVTGVIYGYGAGVAASGVLHVWAAHGTVSRRWGDSWLRGRLAVLARYRKQLARFFFLLDVNALLNVVIKHLDINILGYFYSRGDVAQYKLAKMIVGQADVVLGPLRTVSYANLSSAWAARNRMSVLSYVRGMTAKIGLPLSAGVVLGAVAAGWLVPWLFKDAFAGAVPALRILSVATFLNALFFWLRSAFYATGKVGYWTWLLFVSCCVLVLLWSAWIPKWGHLGAAASWSAVAVLAHGCAVAWFLRDARRM